MMPNPASTSLASAYGPSEATGRPSRISTVTVCEGSAEGELLLQEGGRSRQSAGFPSQAGPRGRPRRKRSASKS